MNDVGKIFVTGASGFIGGRISEILYLTKRFPFRAGVRSFSSCARISRFPMEIVKANLLNTAELDNSLEGVTTIIHCAYGAQGVTEEGTKNLLQIAQDKGIKRVIHLSTIEVYTNPKGRIDEEYLCEYTGNPYGDSKLKAEKICQEFSKNGMEITILRLPIVYGPFSRNWIITMAKMLIAGQLGYFENLGEGKCNLLYVDDLYRAILLCLKNDKSISQVYNINGNEVITWNDYFEILNRKLGLPPLEKIKTSKAQFRTRMMEPVRTIGGYFRDHHMNFIKKVADLSPISNRLLRLLEKRLKTSPSMESFKLFSKDVIYATDKVREHLGFIPKYKIEDGLDISAQWLIHQGFLLNHN